MFYLISSEKFLKIAARGACGSPVRRCAGMYDVRSYFLHEVWLAGYRTSLPYPMEVACRAYTYV